MFDARAWAYHPGPFDTPYEIATRLMIIIHFSVLMGYLTTDCSSTGTLSGDDSTVSWCLESRYPSQPDDHGVHPIVTACPDSPPAAPTLQPSMDEHHVTVNGVHQAPSENLHGERVPFPPSVSRPLSPPVASRPTSPAVMDRGSTLFVDTALPIDHATLVLVSPSLHPRIVLRSKLRYRRNWLAWTPNPCRLLPASPSNLPNVLSLPRCL